MSEQNIVYLETNSLKEHPVCKDPLEDGLLEDIRENGILNELVVNSQHGVMVVHLTATTVSLKGL